MQNAKRVSKLCISIVFYVLESFWRQVSLFFGKEPECLCTVLVYHAVSSGEVSRFAKQMDLLKRLTFPLSTAQLECSTKGIHHVAVTFDDGFQTLCENALPVLLERQIPSTVFIPAGYIGRRPAWRDDPWDPNPDEPVMTETQIKGLPAEWVTVGCHSMTHADLRGLGDDAIRKELVESKEKLESITRKCVNLFSVPYGAFDNRLVKSAASAGYQMVFNSSPGTMNRRKNTFVVGRIRVRPSDWNLEFKLKMLGAYRWLPWAIRLKRQIYSLFRKSHE